MPAMIAPQQRVQIARIGACERFVEDTSVGVRQFQPEELRDGGGDVHGARWVLVGKSLFEIRPAAMRVLWISLGDDEPCIPRKLRALAYSCRVPKTPLPSRGVVPIEARDEVGRRRRTTTRSFETESRQRHRPGNGPVAVAHEERTIDHTLFQPRDELS